MKKTTAAALFAAILIALTTALSTAAGAQCTTFQVFNNTGVNIQLCLDYGNVPLVMAPCFIAPPGFTIQPAPVVGPPPGDPIGITSAGGFNYPFGGARR